MDLSEQKRLKETFKGEKELFKNNSNFGGSALPRIGGVLAATRSLGNNWLKSNRLAVHSFAGVEGYKNPMEKFKKAYLNAEPDIEVISLTDKDRWLVLATDGLWSHTKRS